jgi:hypothetical protein
LLFVGIVPAGDIDLLRRDGCSPFAPLDSSGEAALFFYHAARMRAPETRFSQKKRPSAQAPHASRVRPQIWPTLYFNAIGLRGEKMPRQLVETLSVVVDL